MAGNGTKFILITIVVATAGYYAYGKFFAHGGAGMAEMGGAAPVSAAEVVLRDVRQWYEFSGKMAAVEQVDIRPRVSGTIDSIHFADGAMVKKGDLLFVIDPRPYEAALQAASAAWTLAEADLKRAGPLLAGKAISQRDYDQRHNAAETAKASLTKARLDLEYTRIKSPISGRASRAEITMGNLVEAGMGQSPLLTTIVSSTPIYADFEIDEATFLKYARAGATGNKIAAEIPVILEFDAMSREGRVESFDNRLNNASGTVRVRAVFDNEDGVLVPGLFARVKLGSPAITKSLLITDRAIGTDQNKKFVLVVGEDNKVEHRDIKPGGMAEGLRIVEDGLKEGEKIIVNGLQRSMPGLPVTPEIVPMDAPEATPQPNPQPNPAG